MIVAGAGAIVLAVSWALDVSRGSLWHEAAKAAMQVLAVTFFGALATFATYEFQDRRTAAAAEAERNRDRRARQDELLRSLLDEALGAYNRVKRVRRLLHAETGGDASGRLTIEVYDVHMRRLNDDQLEFEKMKRRAPFIDDERVSKGANLAGTFEKLEKFLRKVIDEYQEKRHVVVGHPEGVRLESLPALSRFLHKSEFEPGAAEQMDEIIGELQHALTLPAQIQPRGEPASADQSRFERAD